MKKILGRSLIALLITMLLMSAVGIVALADIAPENSLASLLQEYKESNPDAAEHVITKDHKLVYADSAYFKDNVNATTSIFSCYAKLGADELKEKLAAYELNVELISDKTAGSGKEILIGVVDRSAQSGFLSKVDANEYGIFVTENNIILLAWNDAALKVCTALFIDYLSAETLSLPVGFEYVGVADADWKADFARPENTTLSSSQYLNDDSLQFLYTGTGATNAGYIAYCEKLVADGYVLVWTNTIGNNEFRMYKNAAKDTALYVAYNDYTYSEEYEAKYNADYTEATNAYLPGDFTKCIRIVSSPLSATVLPDDNNKFGAPQSYTKVTDSYFTILGIDDGYVGTGHVVMLEDGRFIVVDGGRCGCGGTEWCAHTSLIWDTLDSLYEKAHGHKPTAEEPIHLAAWYLTHAHGDHYSAFYYFIKLIDADAAKKSIFKIDYMIANIPGENALFKNTSTNWGSESSFAKLQSFLGGIKLVKPYAGQKLHFANVTIETLMTFGDHLPFVINNTNDTNTVTRFHIESGDKSTSVMFLGDSWRASSRFLCAMYGDYLKADISQISHHGNIGAEKELYDAIAPTGVLFNNTLTAFRTYGWLTTSNKNPETIHAYAVDKYVINDLASVKYVWTAISGKCPTIHITASGAQYDDAFDLVDGSALKYSDVGDAVRSQSGFIKKEVADPHEHSYVCVSFDATHHQYKCECGDVSETAEHTPEADDNDCTTESKCADCGHVVVEAKASHTPDADGTKCKDCGTALEVETTKPVENTTPATDTEEVKNSGCKGSVAAAGLALVVALGICTAFVEKKRG